MDLPWTIFGDFHGMLFPCRKWGKGKEFDYQTMRDFIRMLEHRGLQDMGYYGYH